MCSIALFYKGPASIQAGECADRVLSEYETRSAVSVYPTSLERKGLGKCCQCIFRVSLDRIRSSVFPGNADRLPVSTYGGRAGQPARGNELLKATQIAAVVIGRNEGERLGPSLQSVRQAGLPVVYVDSGSTDESPALATKLGLPVIELDPKRPFSAARGRNEGLHEVLKRWPHVEYVMFLDGDCVLDPDFPSAAVQTFKQHKECAIVTGHLSERAPEASVYNRLCSIEWQSPAGRIDNMNALGGIMAIRVAAFCSVDGFNEDAIAGEEPDLGVRLGLAGYSIIKIDHPMATHDAQIMRFGQWWTRAVRGGHALAHRYARHGRTRYRDGRREFVSDLFWGLALPLAAIALVIPTHGLSLLLFGGYVLFAARVYRYYRKNGLISSDARLVTRFIVYGKFAHVLGIATFYRNWLRGEFRIIEYK